MRERLDLAAIRMDAGLDDGLAVARRHAAGDVGAFRHGLVKVLELRDDALERRAVVAAVRRVEEFLVIADGRELRRRRSSVDADIDGPFVAREITARHLVTVMTRLKRSIIRLVLEQREIRLARLARSRDFGAMDAVFEPLRIDAFRLIRQRRAHGDEIIAARRVDRMLRIEAERLDEAFLELRQEMQRPAEECDMAVNRAALREVADRLVDDGLQNRERNVGFFRAVVHERLDVRLREDAAARRDRVDLLAFGCEVIQPFRVRR